MDATADVLQGIVRELNSGRTVALCAVVATRGSTPQPAGTLACVDEAARMIGTLGGGCVEAELRRGAHETLTKKRNALLTFTLDHDFGYDDGMICGGRMDVAVTTLEASRDSLTFQSHVDQWHAGRPVTLRLRVPRVGWALPTRAGSLTSRATVGSTFEYRVHLEAKPKLVLVGAGHISRVLAGMMVPMGFDVSVIDDRSDCATLRRFPPPIRIAVGPIADTLRTWPIDASTYIVIVTRGHKHDERALSVVLDKPAGYVGMIGSDRKVETVFDDLRHAGAMEQQLARVHAPIGLHIGSVTTEEIALSIAAQLVSIRRGLRRPVVNTSLEIAEDRT